MEQGFYRLNWLQRIGFGAGDLAQNLIYQTISMYLLFFYTDIFGLKAGHAAVMFGVVRIIDVLWDPLVGAYVDKHTPRWGKYRSYLLFAGVPLTALAILCFWYGMADSTYSIKLIYAYATYVGMSMLYTLINVPYGALNSSLTRDTNEITILTGIRMFMANVGGLAVSAGIPILVSVMAGITNAEQLPIKMALFMGLGSLPSFIFMPLVPWLKRIVGKKNMFYIFLSIAILGMAMLYVITKVFDMNRVMPLIYVAQFVKSTGIIVATGYMWALIPEVVSYGEFTTGRRISGIVNALTGIFFKAGMAMGGVIPGFVLAICGYQSAAEKVAEMSETAARLDHDMEALLASTCQMSDEARQILAEAAEKFHDGGTLLESANSLLATASTLPTEPKAWFLTMLVFALTGLFLLIFCFSQCRERVVMDESEAKNVRVSDLWTEFFRNRPLRIVALFFITAFAMMSVGNAAGAYYMNNLQAQTPLAQEGILWLVCVIPAILLLLAMFIISKYELTDERIDEINKQINEKYNHSKHA